MYGKDADQVIIAETDFDLSKYSKSAQVTDKLILEKREEGPKDFDLTEDDHVEVIIKTTVLQEGETPRKSTVNKTGIQRRK
jgi:hypothetical protein